MSDKAKKPKNRFLAGTHVSEDVLVRVLFCWLHGMTYSSIPKAVIEDGGYVDLGMTKLQQTLGTRFKLAKSKDRKVSRQASHRIIRDVSTKIIVREFYDRRNSLAKMMEGEIPDVLNGRKWLMPALGKTTTQAEKLRFVKSMRDTNINAYVKPIANRVLEISSNTIPYDDIRKIPGMVPADVFENHVVIEKMRERYRRFRGYKPSGMSSHVAHQMSIRQGADMLFIHEGYIHNKALPKYDQMETAEYWLLCVTHALAVLLIQLETGQTYDFIKSNVLGSSSTSQNTQPT
ncbi:hypothetical protein AL035_13575 [Salipiger aestuarii]|uniref:Uncharacterized protein n=1 Tax=Salipiger aestuarii TaxID=568098 RepID=A0A327Y176_9RHOB|nr:hypothetical protein [Salipiger aestuarii]KAB2541171.1 hypothetical protein AL035_13575 [Salipiger aestuarii]RAK13806.1 hypothetical protein ATI53_10348 [Salipiger aestuarii]